MSIEYLIKEIENLKEEIEEIKKTLGLILLTLDNHNSIFGIINEIFQKYEIALDNLFTKAEELEQKVFDLQNK
jgi:polyhydroxyalkanoate synthesis regulator phasin